MKFSRPGFRSIRRAALVIFLIPLFWAPPENQRTHAKRYPSDWALFQRMYPHGRADKTAHLKAIEQAADQLAASAALRKSGRSSWQPVGPTNIGGRISALTASPAAPGVFYAGAATGGVFKSIDFGKTWVPVFDEQAVLPIGDLAADPLLPDVVYAGTGEANGGHNNMPGAGLYKSTDAGLTWQQSGLTNTTSISRIAIAPSDTRTLYVAAIGSYFGPDSNRGVYRSDDGGRSWDKVLFLDDSTGVIDLVVHPHDPDILIAAAWTRVRPVVESPTFAGPASGLYRTENGGATWERLGASQGLPAAETGAGRIGLALCQERPDDIYALFTDGFDYTGLYRTRNGGDSWAPADPFSGIAAGTRGFSWYFGQVRVHPTDPDRVFALDVALMGSRDGGTTWPIFEGGIRPSTQLHVDHHALVYDPVDPDHIILGNDGGLYNSYDGGDTWTKVPDLPITQFYNIALDPQNPERLFGGTQDNGTVGTETGRYDDWDHLLGGDGFYTIVHPTNPEILYAESQFGEIRKSSNRGRSWRNIMAGISRAEPKNWATPLVMDPNNPQVLYYGTNHVYKTRDGAGFWDRISPNLAGSSPGDRLGTVTTIAPAASDSNVVFAGTDNARVWVTRDAGRSWNEVSDGLPFRWVTRIAVHPRDARTAYVTFSGLKWKSPVPHVFRTNDQGLTWTDISGDLPDAPVNAILLHPDQDGVLFVATDVGVYESLDDGATWAPPAPGLPVVSVYDLALDLRHNAIVAGTHGRSMYRLTLANTPVSVQDPGAAAGPNSFQLAQNYPNPFNAGTVISYAVPESGDAELRVYDLAGRVVRTLAQGHHAAGTRTVQWNGRDDAGTPVASGLYLYQLRTQAGLVMQKRMVLLK